MSRQLGRLLGFGFERKQLEPLALQVPPRSLILAAVFLRLILIAVAEVQDYLAEVGLPEKRFQPFAVRWRF